MNSWPNAQINHVKSNSLNPPFKLHGSEANGPGFRYVGFLWILFCVATKNNTIFDASLFFCDARYTSSETSISSSSWYFAARWEGKANGFVVFQGGKQKKTSTKKGGGAMFVKLM